MPRADATAYSTELLSLWLEQWQRLSGARLAPEMLEQPVNPGWTFGNIFVNSGNSSDPATELRIVQQVSYGRQLGRTMDALAVLVDEVDTTRLDREQRAALDAFRQVREQVEDAKSGLQGPADATRQLAAGIRSLARGLRELRRTDPALHRTLAAALHDALQE